MFLKLMKFDHCFIGIRIVCKDKREKCHILKKIRSFESMLDGCILGDRGEMANDCTSRELHEKKNKNIRLRC